MIYDGCTLEELQMHFKNNKALQEAVEKKINALTLEEEDCIRMLKDDLKAIELLNAGWTGANAEKYVSWSLLENESLQKRVFQVISQEKECLHDELKRLCFESESISNLIEKATEKE